jgi:hypothetical protein
MSNPIDKDALLLRVAEDCISLRRELIDVSAGQMAAIEYLCCLAEKAAGVEANAAKKMTVSLTEKHRQSFLERVEDVSVSMAAILDTRSASDVADGLDSP